jgi:hypothetical protein
LALSITLPLIFTKSTSTPPEPQEAGDITRLPMSNGNAIIKTLWLCGEII